MVIERCMLIKTNIGYKTKTSKVFTVQNILRLCNENQDLNWLVVKVFDFNNLVIS